MHDIDFGKFIKRTLIGVCIILSFIFVIRPKLWPQVVRFEEELHTEVMRTRDETHYETRKQVEDTCRATMATYTFYATQYEQYRDDESDYGIAAARNALTMANQQAAIYNEYILQNNWVWDKNIPRDIRSELPVIR